MFATLQFLTEGNSLLRLHRLPLSLVDTIAHTRLKILACGIQQVEGDLGLVVAQHLLRQIDTQRLLAVTERQGEFTMMGLTSRISDIGTDHKGIEHRMIRLWQVERHLGLKLTLCVGDGLTLIDLYPIMAVA